jgi:protein phosphatase 1L
MRIQNNNGIIFNNRVEGQLSVSRAFGNLKLKEFVIAEPEGQTWPLTVQDDLLILSSDGLYNSYSQEHVVKRVLELRTLGLPLG